ncbi:MAG: SpoIID/LytB domain-containing protein [Pirellulaceae bacterium]
MRLVVVCRFLTVLALATSVLSGTVSATTGTADFSFSGSGWGHGVGLSQYGAKAMAADGASYEQILLRYFTGASVGLVASVGSGTFIASEPAPLWIGLIQDSGTVSFTVDLGSAQLCFDGVGGCFSTTQPGETYRFGPEGTGNCVFLRVLASGASTMIGSSGPCDASVRPTTTETTISLPFKARSYRHGTLRFRQAPISKGIHTIFQTGIDGYMKGISEVPESWPVAAVEAQVVVSRSYAVWAASGRGGEGSLSVQRKDDCYCNLRDDADDQVFRGWTGETSHPKWVEAVDATAQKVLTHGGQVAFGMYSSSSGGSTENYQDAFGGPGYPYLTTVGDSPAFSDSANNPHAYWEAGYRQDTLAGIYGFSWVSDAEVIERNPSGSARTVRLVGITQGERDEVIVEATELRAALSLWSTTFDIAVTPRFVDLPRTHIFAGEILGLQEMGVTLGCTPTNFCPDQTVTRAEMAAFLTRALGLLPVAGVNPFSDDADHVLETEINTLYANGITTGCSAQRYCPDQTVTRAEMAAFLTRAFNLLPSDETIQFVDDAAHYFDPEIAALSANGVTKGCTPTSFCPDQTVTRAEMAAFLIRALG